VLEGDACVSCHEGEEEDLGASLVEGGPLEATLIEGKNPTVDLQVQAAYDADNAYSRFQWRTQMDRAGP
jgi:hypothetical protein